MSSNTMNLPAGNAAESAEHHRQPDSEADLPGMNRFTLRFREATIERDYLDAMLQQTTLLARFGIALALVVYLLFAMLDAWIPSAALPFIWKVRVGVLLLGLAMLALSFTPVFQRYRESFMSVFMLLLGIGLLVILGAAPQSVVNQYYAGFLLLIIGAHTVLGLRFPLATVVSVALIGMYLASELSFREHTGMRIFINTSVLVFTLVAVGVGAYLAERQRRLAHCRRRVIERSREESRRDALHDPLTGLPNRRLFMERLNQAVARGLRHQTLAAVLFIDLDAFKPINDTHGHVFGDKLLKAVAERLSERVRLTDTVARLGGDEFVVLLEDLADPSTALVLKERILKGFDTPFCIDNERLRVALSIGMALHPVDARQPRELLESADQSMYRMKQHKRGQSPCLLPE